MLTQNESPGYSALPAITFRADRTQTMAVVLGEVTGVLYMLVCTGFFMNWFLNSGNRARKLHRDSRSGSRKVKVTNLPNSVT